MTAKGRSVNGQSDVLYVSFRVLRACYTLLYLAEENASACMHICRCQVTLFARFVSLRSP